MISKKNRIIFTLILLSVSVNAVFASSMVGSGSTNSNLPISLDLGGSSSSYDHKIGNETAHNASVNHSSSPDGDLSGYGSLSDIIKAQDWDALEKYTESINATTTISDTESDSDKAQQSFWDNYYASRQASTCG